MILEKFTKNISEKKSLHASITGSDIFAVKVIDDIVISIHTSLTGSDLKVSGTKSVTRISIHTSREGSDGIFAQINIYFFMQNAQYF